MMKIHDRRQDDHRDQDHRDRVDHRALDLALEALGLLHELRTSRWATTPSIVAVSRKGSSPRSSRRMIELGASLVWSVESTRWPVSDACTAI
jgi:hypothetical protein